MPTANGPAGDGGVGDGLLRRHPQTRHKKCTLWAPSRPYRPLVPVRHPGWPSCGTHGRARQHPHPLALVNSATTAGPLHPGRHIQFADPRVVAEINFRHRNLTLPAPASTASRSSPTTVIRAAAHVLGHAPRRPQPPLPPPSPPAGLVRLFGTIRGVIII